MPDSCDPVDCSLPGSFVHGILQARILEWVTISFSTQWCSNSRISLEWEHVWKGRYTSSLPISSENILISLLSICMYTFIRINIYVFISENQEKKKHCYSLHFSVMLVSASLGFWLYYSLYIYIYIYIYIFLMNQRLFYLLWTHAHKHTTLPIQQWKSSGRCHLCQRTPAKFCLYAESS